MLNDPFECDDVSQDVIIPEVSEIVETNLTNSELPANVNFVFTKGVSQYHIDQYCQTFAKPGILSYNVDAYERRCYIEYVAGKIRSVGEGLRALVTPVSLAY